MDYLVLISLNGLFFLAWVVMMFRTLFGHRRRAATRTGKMFPGVKDTLREWHDWWHSAELKRERRLLIFLTVAVLATLGLMVALVPSV